MSKLADKVRRAARLESAPIGFGATATRSRGPSLLLTARAPASAAPPAGELASRGVDVILLSLADPQAEMARVARWVREIGEVPCGAQVMAADGRTVAGLKEAGADFLAFDAEVTSAEALLEPEMGYVVALSGEPTDSFLRVLEGFSFDGLWLHDWRPDTSGLTARRLMELRRLCVLSRTPLFLPVSPDIGAAELQCLRDAGAVAVVVDAWESGTWERLPGLRKAIDGLPPRVRRREERPEALLPPTREVIVAEEEEEEEEFPLP